VKITADTNAVALSALLASMPDPQNNDRILIGEMHIANDVGRSSEWYHQFPYSWDSRWTATVGQHR